MHFVCVRTAIYFLSLAGPQINAMILVFVESAVVHIDY